MGTIEEERARREAELWEKIRAKETERRNASRTEGQRRAFNVLKNLAREFAALNIDPTLSRKKARSAYRKRALEVHPDKPGGSPASFREVKQAADNVGSALTDM